MNGATEAELGPVDWDLAVSTAVRLVRPGPVIGKEEAEHVVGRLRELAPQAEVHVRELTGLGQGLPLLPGEVVDRPAWVAAAAQGLAALTGPAMPRQTGPMAGILAGTAGVQAGVVMAFLSSRVLGQYDPFSPQDQLAGRLLLVAPNIVGAQQALDVPDDDFRMWVCLHECTHRLQFTGVPWLRRYFSDQVTTLLSSMDEERAPLSDVIRDFRQKLREGDGPMGLIELVQSPQQKAVLDRLIALSTLLEGHADHVMDAVGPSVVPSVSTIRSRFSARRKGGGLLDRILRTVLGVEAKVRQYEEGARFTEYVVERVGMDGFNAIWTSADTLPTRAEIAEPMGWLRRVAP
ncbi:zinc-dependent metalloprotease [Lentzea sp. DG1S-22]|uniref:zinc-dependent metalloprotease n=1 Tax=unclassified Lentzea TaxID=2643253 RepID=UPI0027E025D3|nr:MULTISPECIES: zinc-dependent metalloprotease [unclassified Lentzea]MCG8924554.1 zinc-dependent metalloprotease [Lentzea sp. CC55]WVH78589.1 zinc-dependent metalloprotease [Lentzea sp. DG1S-22]